MKRCNSLIIALCATLPFAPQPTMASESAQVPHTPAAKAAADLISKAERAITDYVAACASRDGQHLDRLTTEDVRIEFALDEPGTYLSMDASSLVAGCGANAALGRSGSDISKLWIFPTLEANSVFVHYEVSAPSIDSMPQRQLLLLEMRGDRIARMVNFATSPSARSARSSRW
jgi:hypothetical protein